MGDVLVRIKRAVLNGNVAFTRKSLLEMECDGLTEMDVAESILSAVAIYKKLRSTSLTRRGREYLYIIQSPNFSGLAIYSKGKLVNVEAGGFGKSPAIGRANSAARATLFATSLSRPLPEATS
jgi:hypothetical protein